jgi:carboxylesterase type B
MSVQGTAEWPSKSKKPVMLWIHPGGNTGGGAALGAAEHRAIWRRSQ